jgi:hypothetical protein
MQDEQPLSLVKVCSAQKVLPGFVLTNMGCGATIKNPLEVLMGSDGCRHIQGVQCSRFII